MTVAGFVAGVGLLVYLGRGLWFLTDEWAFLLDRRELTLANVMRPHNEHFVAFTVLLYRGLFYLGGLTDYWPYYLTSLAFHTGASVAGWIVLRRLDVPPLPALLAGLSLLLMGAASEQLFNAFQLGWTAPLLLFLTALLLLDRDTPNDLGAAACLLLAMPFGGIGLALSVGAAAALILRRQFRRALLVSGPAVALYLAWQSVWGGSPPISAQALIRVPGYIAYGSASAVAGFTGLPVAVSGVLLALVAVAVAVRAVREGIPLMGWAALFALVAFLGSAGIARVAVWGIQQSSASRYLYLDALLLLVVLAALMRPLWSRGVSVTAALVLGACLVVNVFTLRGQWRETVGIKGESAVRILAADELLTAGIPHVGAAQPDPLWALDVTADELAELREEGIPLAYDGPVQLTDVIRDEQRLRLQTALTPEPGRTADLRLLAGPAQVSAGAGGCVNVLADPGTALELEATPGIFAVKSAGDTVVHVRRSDHAVFFQIALEEGSERHLALAVPMRPETGGLLTLGFPVPTELALCPRTFTDARSADG